MGSDATGDSPEERRAADLAAEAAARAGALARETALTADNLAEVTAAKAMALASALSEALGEIARRLDQYSAFGRRSRKIIIALAASFTVDIVLTVVLGFTAFSAHDTASANAQLVQEVHAAQVALHAAQLMSCANGNVFRVNQTTIWHDFITLIAKPAAGEPAAQVAKTSALAASFLAHVGVVNHPVNCTALYGK